MKHPGIQARILYMGFSNCKEIFSKGFTPYFNKSKPETTPKKSDAYEKINSSNAFFRKLEAASRKSAKKNSAESSKRTSQLRNLRLRQIRFTSLHYYTRAKHIHTIALYSVILEALLLIFIGEVRLSTFLQEKCLLFLSLLLVFSPVWLNHSLLLNLRDKIHQLQNELVEKTKEHRILLGASLVLMMLIKMAISFSSFPLWILLLLIPLFLLVGARAIEEQKINKARLKELEASRSFWVEDTNLHVFITCMVPIIAARLVLLLSVLWGMSPSAEAYSRNIVVLLGVITGLVLLILAKPEIGHYTYLCKRCSFRTSRALKSLGFCPQCSPEEFTD